MTKKTLAALNKSIQHWTRLSTGKIRYGEVPYSESCALCKLFIRQDCFGCPVSQKTKQAGCQGTPYFRAQNAWEDGGLLSRSFKSAAQKELAFLKSLLPK